ncbi:MAG: helix-turn-helix domain-containing protein [Tomitella sp.]|nr:helix-turn-helix domain-containing protein [Tomitella sp.]
MATPDTTYTRSIKLCIDSRALTTDQQAGLKRSVGTARKAWNWALADANRMFKARRDYVADLARREASNDDGVRELLADPAWRKRAYQAAARECGTYSAAHRTPCAPGARGESQCDNQAKRVQEARAESAALAGYENWMFTYAPGSREPASRLRR